jgi:hypothetical protein
VAERRDGDHHFVILDYLVVAEPGRPAPGSDVDEAVWVALSAVPDLPLVPGLAQFLADHGVLSR